MKEQDIRMLLVAEIEAIGNGNGLVNGNGVSNDISCRYFNEVFSRVKDKLQNFRLV
jgi:hypothetical protein